jgi:microcystin-dependent protein
MSDPFIGEIKIVPFNFAPQGWADCNGQLLSIAQNSALFSLLGTNYGGNGTTTFALPDLRGRFPTHEGQGPGLSPRSLGEVSGAEYHTLQTTQMPAHNHTAALLAHGGEGDRSDPSGAYPARAEEPLQPYGGSTTTPMGAGGVQVGVAGNSQPVGHMPPYLCLRFIIALQGIYPSRS